MNAVFLGEVKTKGFDLSPNLPDRLGQHSSRAPEFPTPIFNFPDFVNIHNAEILWPGGTP